MSPDQRELLAAKSREEITPSQRVLLRMYEELRLMGVRKFQLRQNATVEEIMPHVAILLKLPMNASDQKILEHPKVQKILTDSWRRRVVAVFNLPEETTWLDIKVMAERLRKREAAKKKFVVGR